MKNIRLLRVIAHFFIINGLFFFTYKLRLMTDLLPGIQLPLPFINAEELMIFSLISSILFVGIGVIKDFYPLNKRVINHFQKLGKVWIYWFIAIAFLSYFGQGFLFFFGISRFIILFASIFTWLVVLFFDQLWKRYEYRQQQKS